MPDSNTDGKTTHAFSRTLTSRPSAWDANTRWRKLKPVHPAGIPSIICVSGIRSET